MACARTAQRLEITLKRVGIDTGSLFFAFNRNPRHYIHKGVTDPRYDGSPISTFMRAMAHAIDKRGIINLCFRGLAVPAVSDVSPENKIFYNPNLKDYDYDLEPRRADSRRSRLSHDRPGRARRSRGPSAGFQPDD